MARRGFLLVGTLGACAVACGLGTVGSLSSTGPLVDAAVETEAALPDGPVPGDGGLDVNPANCAAACDGGRCESGFCVFDCATDKSCAAPVKCPPGVPCKVNCSGSNSCRGGVDCASASACNVICSGNDACTTNPVACSGMFCDLACTGNGACAGLSCDAGTCNVDCHGPNTCQGPVQCSGRSCSVACGASAGVGNGACNAGVTCTASKDCRVDCLADNACAGAIAVTAAETAEVHCDRPGTCSNGVFEQSADGGITCGAVNTCQNGIACSGARCTTRCTDGPQIIRRCCNATACPETTTNGCFFTSVNCP